MHAGFDTTAANRDPDRLVPLDAARALGAQGGSAAVHDEFFTTTGVDTPVAVAARIGRRSRAELRNARGRRRDPDRHLRNRNALRGNAGEGVGDERGSRPCSSRRCRRSRRWSGRTASCAASPSRTPPATPPRGRRRARAARAHRRARARRCSRPRSLPRTVWEIDGMSRACGRRRGLARARSRARPRALRVEAAREPAQLDAIAPSLRTFDEAVAYPPNQVVIGNLAPEDLWELPRPWWKHPVDGASPEGACGDVDGRRPRSIELLARRRPVRPDPTRRASPRPASCRCSTATGSSARSRPTHE